MATTPLTVQSKSYAGLTPSFTAAGGTGAGNGFTFVNDGLTDFRIKNANVAACTATIKGLGKVGGVQIADQTVTVVVDAHQRHGVGWEAVEWGDSTIDTGIWSEDGILRARERIPLTITVFG